MPQMYPSNYEDQTSMDSNKIAGLNAEMAKETDKVRALNEMFLVMNPGPCSITAPENQEAQVASTTTMPREISSEFVEPLAPIIEVPTFAMVAEHIRQYIPWHVGLENAEEFIQATANVLLRANVELWKQLSSDAPDSGSEAGDSVASAQSMSGNRVSWFIIGVEFRRLMQIKGNPKPDVMKTDRFRNGRGPIPKYFKKALKVDKENVTMKKMEKFSCLLSGFISKLYFSKNGYTTTFDQLSKDVGHFIADQALKAADICPLFKYKLVVPADLYNKYNLCHAVSDTFPKDQLLRLHTLRSEPVIFETIDDNNEQDTAMNKASQPMPRLNTNAYDTEDYSFSQRIEAKQAAIEACEADIRVARETIAERSAKIKQLKEEIESLKFLEEQKINAENLVTGMRNALNNDERAFKEISEVVVMLVPEIAKNLCKINKEQMTQAVLSAIESVATGKSTNSKNVRKGREHTSVGNEKSTTMQGPRKAMKTKEKASGGKVTKPSGENMTPKEKEEQPISTARSDYSECSDSSLDEDQDEVGDGEEEKSENNDSETHSSEEDLKEPEAKKSKLIEDQEDPLCAITNVMSKGEMDPSKSVNEVSELNVDKLKQAQILLKKNF